MGRGTRFMRAASKTEHISGRRAEPGQPDAELDRVVQRWPLLPAHIRQAILTLVASTESRSPAPGQSK